MTDRWLIALDVDGTVLREDGVMNDPVVQAVGRVRDAGHAVMLATGRSVAMTLPILERLGIEPEYVVCSNGAITLKRDPDAVMGYSRFHVETFDPSEVLTTIRGASASASTVRKKPTSGNTASAKAGSASWPAPPSTARATR